MNILGFLKTFVAVGVVCACIFSTGHSVQAQTDVDLDPDWGGRISVTVDKKLSHGLHLYLEEEARVDGNFGSFNRLQTTFGATYKLPAGFKLGLGYALIAPYSSSNSAFKSVRHRLMLDASYSYRFGDWQFSLKERLQATYRMGDMNEYQNPRTALTLKSRLKVQYKGLRRLTPYAYIELRNTLNAPVINALYNATTNEYMTESGSISGDAGWFLDGFSGVYINRVRGCLGAEYRLDRCSRLEAYLLLDRVSDKQVDANAEGTKLKSYTREQGFIGQVCLGYSYSF